MQLGDTARTEPGKAAVVLDATGAVTTFAELDEESRRLARLLYGHGLRRGDVVAILMTNGPRFLAAAWAAQRSGLYYTPVNWHLSDGEVAYVVGDSGARVLLASAALAGTAAAAVAGDTRVQLRLMADGDPAAGFESYAAAVAAASGEPVPDAREGGPMFYSSGTTGRPKGIKPTLASVPFGTGGRLDQLLAALYGFDATTTYLCPGPLYHAAPLAWSVTAQRLGGTVVVLERFDAEQALRMIERHRVTHAQFVPTMFVRMLKLPAEVRASYDLSSLRAVVHAAAPCPVEVKRRMIDWLGPIVHEYYAGSEGNGYVCIDGRTWLTRPGSVGRPAYGSVHICDDTGRELPADQIGSIWFSDTNQFSYHNDPAKTAAAYDERGWSTLGDLGHTDADGFLYLSDRRSDLIITGGVNVYPAEVEEVLALHPAVRDVAVVGVPDAEMGQQVRAVVEVDPPAVAGPELAAELVAYCRVRLAHFKCPQAVDFDGALPRLPSGKLLRRQIRARYGSADPGGREEEP